jgi:hypothetical protein
MEALRKGSRRIGGGDGGHFDQFGLRAVSDPAACEALRQCSLSHLRRHRSTERFKKPGPTTAKPGARGANSARNQDAAQRLSDGRRAGIAGESADDSANAKRVSRAL